MARGQQAAARLEIDNRAPLWRRSTGDDHVDLTHWVTHVTNEPTTVAAGPTGGELW